MHRWKCLNAARLCSCRAIRVTVEVVMDAPGISNAAAPRPSRPARHEVFVAGICDRIGLRLPVFR